MGSDVKTSRWLPVGDDGGHQAPEHLGRLGPARRQRLLEERLPAKRAAAAAPAAAAATAAAASEAAALGAGLVRRCRISCRRRGRWWHKGAESGVHEDVANDLVAARVALPDPAGVVG